MNPLPKKSLPNICEINEINMEIKIKNYFSRFICSMYAQKSHSEIENLTRTLCKSELLRLQTHSSSSFPCWQMETLFFSWSKHMEWLRPPLFLTHLQHVICREIWLTLPPKDFQNPVASRSVHSCEWGLSSHPLLTAVAFGPVPHFVQKQEDSSRTYQTRSLGAPNPPKTPIFSEWKPQALAQPTRLTRTWVPPTRPLGHTSPASSLSGLLFEYSLTQSMLPRVSVDPHLL